MRLGPQGNIPKPVVLAFVILSIATLYGLYDNSRDDRARADALAESRQELVSDIGDLAAANEANAKKLEANGLEPAVDPEDATKPVEVDSTDEISQGDIALAVSAFCTDTGKCEGEAGEPGAADEVTTAQVTRAVVRYCDANGQCQGADGQDGRQGPAGPPPSSDAILAAVTTFCADGACRGPQGEPGQDGADGSQGDPGRPPTVEEIAQAVANYCAAHNGCQGPGGPAGPPGVDGEDGEDAPSITDATCSTTAPGEFTLTITLSTGRTIQASCAGPVAPQSR